MKCINCETEFKITEQEAYVMKGTYDAYVDCPECGSFYNLSYYKKEIKDEEKMKNESTGGM